MTRFNILVTALGLLITLCGSADAATVHHFRTHPHHHVTSSVVANSFASEPGRPPVHEYAPGSNDATSDHEGSTYGGATLLPDD
jgi:hypothetical protein